MSNSETHDFYYSAKYFDYYLNSGEYDSIREVYINGKWHPYTEITNPDSPPVTGEYEDLILLGRQTLDNTRELLIDSWRVSVTVNGCTICGKKELCDMCFDRNKEEGLVK